MNLSMLLAVILALMLSPLLTRADDDLPAPSIDAELLGDEIPAIEAPEITKVTVQVSAKANSDSEDTLPEPEVAPEIGPAPGSLEFEMKTITMLEDATPTLAEQIHPALADR